jgi:hypothetical protein
MRLLFALAMLQIPARLLAQKPVIAPIVQEGLDTYRAHDAAAAVAAWTRGWGQADSTKVRQLRESLRVIEENYGRMQGYEVISTTQPGKRVRRSYAILYYEGRPLYAFFHAYQSLEGTWKVMDMTWNTNWKEVMSPSVLGE